MEMIAAIKTSRTEGANVQEFSWNDVEMKDGFIIVPYPAGSETWSQLPGAKESFNMIKGYLAGRLPAVKVAFDSQGIGLIQNIYDLRDALTVMHVKHTLQYGTMETEEKNRDIIDAVSEMGPEATRIFVPRDVTGRAPTLHALHLHSHAPTKTTMNSSISCAASSRTSAAARENTCIPMPLPSPSATNRSSLSTTHSNHGQAG